MTIQMDNGQRIYKNRTLTDNLPQPAQDTNPLPLTNAQEASLLSNFQEARLLSISINNPGKQNLYKDWLKMARIWFITANFPSLCSYFQLRTDQREPDKHSSQSHRMPCVVSLPPASLGQQPPLRAYLKPSLSPRTLLALEALPKHKC